MPRIIDWDRQIGRRLTLRDLHVFFAVVECGGIGKAALRLGVSQPAVSQIIADLEDTLGVHLLDRNPRGVVATMYGDTLLRYGRSAFQELKQGIQEIEFLADPAAGELRIGCNVGITGNFLAPVIERFSAQHPRVVVHVDEVPTPAAEYPDLRQHKVDLVLIRLSTPRAEDNFYHDLNIETMFDDRLLLFVGAKSRWARRRRIEMVELLSGPWTLTPRNTFAYQVVAEAFAVRGLAMPEVAVPTFSVPLRATLAAGGRFLTVFPASVMQFEAKRYGLTALPIELPRRRWPVAVVTLKDRTLSPLAKLFIQCFRDFSEEIRRDPRRNNDRA